MAKGKARSKGKARGKAKSKGKADVSNMVDEPKVDKPKENGKEHELPKEVQEEAEKAKNSDDNKMPAVATTLDDIANAFMKSHGV